MYTVHVFGKEGCTKCATLKRRLEAMLKEDKYKEFSMEYHDVLTVPGLLAFVKADCLNPNRIPAMLVANDNGYVHHDGWQTDPSRFEASSTVQWVGRQTDYDAGKGLITPEMIRGTLDAVLGN